MDNRHILYVNTTSRTFIKLSHYLFDGVKMAVTTVTIIRRVEIIWVSRGGWWGNLQFISCEVKRSWQVVANSIM